MKLKKLTEEELKKLLDLHERWLADDPDGLRIEALVNISDTDDLSDLKATLQVYTLMLQGERIYE